MRVWPATAEMVNGTRHYSLRPLLGAYADPILWEDYGVGFASLCLDGLRGVGHSSVRSELEVLIRACAA